MNAHILKGRESDKQYINLSFYTKGGMGEIYTALDTVNNSTVAIKLIRVDNLTDENLLEEEFNIASTLSHPNIVKTFYYDKFNDSTGDYFYSVMEFSKNGSLRKLIQSSSSMLPLENCFSNFTDLLKALCEAHKYIIHRDLKPENILRTDSNTLQVCDFGIAKYVDMLTRTKTFKGYGTIAYMAPECWLFDTNTVQMDIYSLGIIFYELLTLKLPFSGPTERDFRDQHLYENLPAPSNLRSDTPLFLSDIIRKMTTKNTNERYKNVSEVLEAFINAQRMPATISDEIQYVLKNAEYKINQNNQTELLKKKRENEIIEKNKNLIFSIGQLFDKFSEVADNINIASQSEKITYKRFIVEVNAFASHLKLNYFNHAINISFYNQDISEYLKGKKEAYLSNQEKLYGLIMQEYQPDFIERDNVILIGNASINFTLDNGKNVGINLVLLKESHGKIYGDWYYCKFKDSLKNSFKDKNLCYSIDPPEFYNEYNFGRSRTMHVRNMDFLKIDVGIIAEIISYMPLL